MEADKSSCQNLIDHEINRENLFSQLNKNKIINNKETFSFKRSNSNKFESNPHFLEEAISFRANKETSIKEDKKYNFTSKRRGTQTVETSQNRKIRPSLDKKEFKKEISRAFKEKTLKVIQNLRTKTILESPQMNSKIYLIPEKSSKLWNKDVFWSKDKLDEIWGKIKTAKFKLTNKIESDIDDLQESIIKGEEEVVLSKLLNKEFQEFYNRELLRSNLLEFILELNKPEMLLKILKDNFYIYDYLYPFHKIADSAGISRKKIHLYHKYEDSKRNQKKLMSRAEIDNNLKIFYKNVIKYDLYDKKPDLIKLLAFLFAENCFYENFMCLIEKHEELFTKEKEEFNKFKANHDINFYSEKQENYRFALKICLENDLEDLAIFLVTVKNEMMDESIIDQAVNYEQLEFLRTIWQKTYNAEEVQLEKFNALEEIKKRKSGVLYYKISYENFNNGKPIFSLGYLIKKFIDNKSYAAIDQITSWKGIEHDKNFLENLYEHDCFDQIDTLISNKKIYSWPPTKEQFKKIIVKEKFQLIPYFLGFKDCRTILNDNIMQSYIIEKYMKHGHKMYYGGEMLIYIYKSQWELSLTRPLCNHILRTIKTKDILNCHSPILTCLLLCEFLNEIRELTIQYATICEKVINELKLFCNKIQNSNRDEEYVRFLMKQKDSRCRSSFQIASENNFFEVLETAEIGTIVKKMWNGKISNNGFFKASSMFRYLDSNLKSLDPFHSFEKLDQSKIYFYQMRVWTDSCSLRYLPESLSTVGLIILYNLFIYFLVVRGQMLNNFHELDKDLKILLGLYFGWVCSIFFHLLIIALFCFLTKRKFINDIWTYIELLMFIFAILLIVDTNTIDGKFTDMVDSMKSLLFYLEIPLSKNLKVQSDSFSSNNHFITRAIILSINDVLVWLRITGILLTFKQIGPVIRMIYLMGKLLMKYILIFVLFMACCAAVFTAIFNKNSYQFKDFSTSIMTLFGVFQNTFDLNGFDDNYMTSGPILLVFYVCIAGVLLINIIIALLSNVYEQLSTVVDATHRAVLISYFRKYKWDKEYGYLIFLTTPLSILNYAIFPFSFCISKKNRQKFNEWICRIYYSLFYFPFIFITYLISSIVFIPCCYIKGIFIVIANQKDLKIRKLFKVWNGVKWFFGGLFYLLYIYFRDAYNILKTIFINSESKHESSSRLKRYIAEQDVIIFLKFIHSRKSTDPHDIHTLFMDYLSYEQIQKAKYDQNLKEINDYWKKLNSVRHDTKLSKLDGTTAVIYNNRSVNLKSKISSDYIKKNLIIIEILENFLIEDDSENIIDLEKIKKLLPMTTNINDAYIKRLVYTDLRSLNKAVNKLKSKANVFLQYQLLNKIFSSAIMLDKEIDNVLLLEMRKMGNKNTRNYNKDEITELFEEEDKTKKDLNYYKEFDLVLQKVMSDIKLILENKKIEKSTIKNEMNEALNQNFKTIINIQDNLDILEEIENKHLNENKNNINDSYVSGFSERNEIKELSAKSFKVLKNNLFTIPESVRKEEDDKNIVEGAKNVSNI